jgi:hypothetical protein
MRSPEKVFFCFFVWTYGVKSKPAVGHPAVDWQGFPAAMAGPLSIFRVRFRRVAESWKQKKYLSGTTRNNNQKTSYCQWFRAKIDMTAAGGPRPCNMKTFTSRTWSVEELFAGLRV